VLLAASLRAFGRTREGKSLRVATIREPSGTADILVLPTTAAAEHCSLLPGDISIRRLEPAEHTSRQRV
jgi:hypothetical protein